MADFEFLRVSPEQSSTNRNRNRKSPKTNDANEQTRPNGFAETQGGGAHRARQKLEKGPPGAPHAVGTSMHREGTVWCKNIVLRYVCATRFCLEFDGKRSVDALWVKTRRPTRTNRGGNERVEFNRSGRSRARRTTPVLVSSDILGRRRRRRRRPRRSRSSISGVYSSLYFF